jgi:hypothetical protein
MCNTVSFSAICKHIYSLLFPKFGGFPVLTFQRRYKDDEGEGVVGGGGSSRSQPMQNLYIPNYGFVLNSFTLCKKIFI